MSIFVVKKNSARPLAKQNFRNEKELQNFIERNMEEFFGIRFLSSEFTISSQHGGRIDSLGLDENNSPVIIEYKWGEKSNIINQGLFYLDWLVDHPGDFQLLVNKKFGKTIDVDFSSPRVLLIAQTFNKYDKYAINRMAENIELWGYSRYENDIFKLKLIASSRAKQNKNSKKQLTKVNYREYTIDKHLENKSKKIKDLFYALKEKIFDLEAEHTIEEVPRKIYIGYRTSQMFMQIYVQTQGICISFKSKKELFNDPQKKLYNLPKGLQRRGVFSEVFLEDFDELDYVVDLISQAYLQSE